MLGIGLHSYGFMDSAFWWLAAFMGTQLLAIAVVGLPRAWWRSAGATLKVFDDASHLSVAEQPQQFAQAVESFLKNVR